MAKRFATTLLVLFIVPAIVFAQDAQVKVKPLIMDEPTSVNTNDPIPESTTADGNYIEVDLMANAFGTGSGDVNPLAFDPYSGTLALFHRGHSSYALGSGDLWYNISTDGGVTWSRVASINGAASQQIGRYPSMAISNPTKGDINTTTGVFAWPELQPGGASFGWVGYGVDQPLGAGFTLSGIIQGVNDFSSEAPCWASDNSAWVYWTERSLAVNAAVTFFRTEDFITVEMYVPPQWEDSVFSSNGQYLNGGVSYNGIDYMCVIGAFNANVFPPLISGWPIGYSKSTDNGTTWSNFVVPDFTTIPALSMYDEVMDFDSTDGTTVQYDGDIQVDKNGYVHLVTALTDTLTYSHAVVDIFETASGWDGEVIFHGLDIKTYGLGPGLGQMGPATFVAMDSSRSVIAVQWINKSPNTQWADVYFSHKRLDGTDTWSVPVNLTMSDSINNTAAHFAPQIMDNGAGQYTAFSSYSYVTGATGPFGDTTLTTSIYVAAVPFEELIVGVDDEIVVNNFNLEQNYPNPFNQALQLNTHLLKLVM